MRIRGLAAVISFVSLETIIAQEYQGGTQSNSSILQVLSNTSDSPALKFVEFLYSSPEYFPIIDILSDPSSNVTLFVPSDQVYYDATGEQPPAANTSGSQNSSQTMNGTQTTVGVETRTTTASSSTQLGDFLSSLLSSLSAATTSSSDTQPSISTQPTQIHESFVYVQAAPTSLADARPKYGKIAKEEIVKPYEHFINAVSSEEYGNWQEVTTDPMFADQFRYIDILSYHLVNGSVQLENSTIILNTFLTNSTVNKFGDGSPIRIQQQQGEQQSGQPQQSNSTQQPNATQQPTQVDQPTQLPGSTEDPLQPIEPGIIPMSEQQQQWLQQQYEGVEMVESDNSTWTVGTGTGNDAQILVNQTIQALNGIVYVIDKILIPPVSLTDTLQIVENASYFKWIYSESESDSTLFEAANTTIFVPTNDALQSLSFIDMNTQNISNIMQAHIIPGVYYSTNITSESTNVTSIAGTDITLTNSDPTNNNSFTVNNVKVVQANILLDSGVMHLIDGILSYPAVESTGNHSNETQPSAGPSSSPTNQSSAMKYTGSYINIKSHALLSLLILGLYFSNELVN